MSRWQEKKSKDDFESNISFFKIWIHSRFPHAWPANPCDYLPQTHGIAPVKHIIYMNPHSHPDGFYWGHQCSWTLAAANSMQVSNMQSDDRQRNQPCHTYGRSPVVIVVYSCSHCSYSLQNPLFCPPFSRMVCLPVWPDWAIFESSWLKNFLQEYSKCLVTFYGPFWKTSIFK